ncbi:MAG TPA: LytR C-terminal domain-containing protein [Sphingomicrobium sp.]|nr:LytR C-terminal domain-containing protein [Sphingomicrobium sp.]
MRRGGKIVGTVAILSVAACGGEQGKLEIRSTATPLAAGQRPVPFRIAEARGQFALGNVALALEGFRIALREDPNSIDAMTGVAACYDRMARFDLSRRHYEAALAIAPADPQLLTAFASSLDLQGRSAEAASVRNEIVQRMARAAENGPPKAMAAASVSPMRAPGQGRQTAIAKPVVPVERASALPAAAPADKPIQSAATLTTAVINPAPKAATPPIGRSVTIALPPPLLPVLVEPPAKPAAKSAVRVAAAPQSPAVVALPATPVAEKPVTLALRPAPPATIAPALPNVATEVAVPILPARPAVDTPPARTSADEAVKIVRADPDAAKEALTVQSGPRLERTSLREVALITAAEPKWRALTVRRTQRSATVRFVPLRQASLSLSGIRILNAARVNRLAARTRSVLVGRGWSPMNIGDAATVRARSVIFYPPNRRRTAVRLSAQFGFVIAQRPGTRQITVLLGQDAARVPALRARA